ncbi:uncharacterized protein LOC127095868 [Lathyrus oleraceus]|uniref:uncharacterized protein LOC127095868 n=1 Tax=Pisum sativum TaxID=3888 RepID=UPI0021D22020|nr:uncharacterized protein LOC127095868 [Pisum sativum]
MKNSNPEGESDKTIKPDPKDKDNQEKEKPYIPSPPYKSPITYPQRLAKTKTESQFKKFLELLKQLHITIPFSEVITQMPSYAKFIKEILLNKRKLDDDSTISLTEECNEIIQNKMPPKLKDIWSFSIPCVIGKLVIDKALYDLGASVSLMPLSISERLNLGNLKPTKISLQLSDCSIKYPVGILENVLVRIGQLYIPTNFVVMNMKED